MRRRGIEHLSYFQVDNPLVHTIVPSATALIPHAYVHENKERQGDNKHGSQ